MLAGLSHTMDGLLEHSLIVVTGKGGVGKSTVAAALGLLASRRGLRTIVVEVAAREDVARALASDVSGGYADQVPEDGLHHISIEPQRAMDEYLRQQLPMGAVAALLSHNRIFTALTAAAPGMSELLTMGKVWELARHGRDGRGGEPYDVVVLDAPATGHALAMLQAPRTFATVARVGPVAGQGRAIASFLGDPRRTAVLAVCTAEEMPVTETLELRSRLREQMALELSLVVVNAVVERRFSAADERRLEAAPPSPARHAALFAAAWARRQHAEIARLQHALDAVRLLTLPFMFRSGVDRSALELLATELDA